MKAIIYAKCIIVENSAATFHRAISDALESIGQAAQMYGWGEAAIADDDVSLPVFSKPEPPYGDLV